jgi:hypothetical protein
MAPGAPAVRRPWRWPLGWLYALALGLDAGLAVRLGWLFTHARDEHTFSVFWWFLALYLWLLLAGVRLLALVLGLRNAFWRQARRALAWFALSTIAIGSCAAASFPVLMVTVIAPSVGDPPHVYDEK